MAAEGNIFKPLAQGAAPQQITQSSRPHPQAKIGVNQDGPVETNKFFSNLYLGSQSQPVYTNPYSLSWSKGGGATSSWGMSISHTLLSQMAMGTVNPTTNAISFFASPVGIQSLVISAAELSRNTALTTDSLTAFSVNCNLSPGGGKPLITFPLLQGMGFITAVFKGATPLLQSGVTFRTLEGPSTVGPVKKYKATLADDTQWLIYVRANGDAAVPVFQLNGGNIRGPTNFAGTIQVAKNDNGGAGEGVYDASAGAYPISMDISALANGDQGSYTFKWVKAGMSNKPLLMFALPHHVASMDGATSGRLTAVKLRSQTKGMVTAVAADTWTMGEKLPTAIGLKPWYPGIANDAALTAAQKQLINNVAAKELGGDINAETNLDSMYYSGKGLAKWAQMVYVVAKLTNDNALASAGLQKVKDAFARFVNNRQINPLTYDPTWKGIVSTAGFADSGADFGNTYYNDHHFHYGYFVYAAAIIASLDPTWLTANGGANKDYVNALVRDFANPVSGPYFPFSRSFDWFSGHSWAKGLYESADGKDQESTSEDALASYALKLWGASINDPATEARGNLMLALQSRTFDAYFLMRSSNPNMPQQFIGNKAAGITFENKVDHTTYFGGNFEYVEGIHMIPLVPTSALTRKREFVQQEWNVYFSNGRANSVVGGWRGLLMANLALVDPSTSYNFFADPNFDSGLLDGGASRTWYLAYSALLGGQGKFNGGGGPVKTSGPRGNSIKGKKTHKANGKKHRNGHRSDREDEDEDEEQEVNGGDSGDGSVSGDGSTSGRGAGGSGKKGDKGDKGRLADGLSRRADGLKSRLRETLTKIKGGKAGRFVN